MGKKQAGHKEFDNQQFLEIRQATEKIAHVLDKRLKDHLTMLKSLFVPRRLLGSYVRSAAMEEVPGSDKVFADLQEQYAAICQKPFGLRNKLNTPLPQISDQLEGTPFAYALSLGDTEEKPIVVSSPTKWVLSYRSECPLGRLRAASDGTESCPEDDIKQTILNHLIMVVFLKHCPGLVRLLQDLRYDVETKELNDLGALPVVVLSAPLQTFLPPKDFIIQVTQLSGVPAFQEIIDLDSVDSLPDPLKDMLKGAI